MRIQWVKEPTTSMILHVKNNLVNAEPRKRAACLDLRDLATAPSTTHGNVRTGQRTADLPNKRKSRDRRHLHFQALEKGTLVK
jgi:hypothetical protein